MALAVDIQPSLLTSPRLLDKGKMIDFDVPLDGVVGLALPYAGDFLQTISKGAKKPAGQLWYSVGRYLYVPCAVVLCCVALFLKVAF